MSNFRVGQKVVCVKLHDGNPKWAVDLRIGGVYTVSFVSTGFNSGIDLEEYPVTSQPLFTLGRWSPCYWTGLFRPAVERKTDISIFTAMLNPSKQPVMTE
jgi:hypothetical protein